MKRIIFCFNKVGFIGLGNMGLRMASNLYQKYKPKSLYLYDQNPSVKNHLQQGLKLQQNISALQVCDTIVLMLPNGHISKNVANKLFDKLPKGSFVLDASTISPDNAKEIANLGSARGIQYLDCPVSGGVKGAQLGTLSFMVGARNTQIFNKVKPILESMGKIIVNCGGLGLGQVAKMCNNMAMAVQMIAISQALVLGKKNGIDVKILSDIMKVSSSRCWSVDTYSPVPELGVGLPSGRDYQGGFSVELMLKDLKISSQQSKGRNRLGEQALKIYDSLAKAGFSKKDFGVIYKALLQGKLDN